MNKEILKEYAELKVSAKNIAARVSELMPLILKDIIDAGVDKLPTSLGSFSIKKRKVWKYSPAVTSLEDRVKEAKTTEEADGTATFEEVPQLEFREVKEKE